MALLLQEVPVDPGTWQQFGPFAICFVLLSGVIIWLLRERAHVAASNTAALAAVKAGYDEDVAAHRKQLDAEREANRIITDRLIASAERTAPILERAARALEGAGAR